MSDEKATVIMKEDRLMTVKRDADEQLLNFIKIGENWLLEKHASSDSILYGTRFIAHENI